MLRLHIRRASARRRTSSRRALALAATAALVGSAVGLGVTGAGSAPVAGASMRVRAPSCKQQLVVPAYFYPGPTWTKVLTGQPRDLGLIVNPSNGPGGAPDPLYTKTVARARKEHVLLYGYVDTRFTSTPVAAVEAQVNRYLDWYGIRDVFLDDASSSAAEIGYYRTITAYVRRLSPGAEVMLNPGDYPAPGYAALEDRIVVFEDTYKPFLRAKPPAWVAHHPSRMFVAIVSGVPASRRAQVLKLASSRHFQGVYVTDQSGDPASLYDRLPAYWTSEQLAVTATCRNN